MLDEDLRAVIAKYQQKAFELFNHNIVLEAQIEKLNANLISLTEELDKLKKSKKQIKPEEQF